ncbi:VCBS domain-containing protein [Sansalvadorimonas sp. 2012CJ34-2]|uniref:VCBS domain-containing protein n=1 Tax=Parendozoicomonas callyspongiae TaxID=2942213 RepID=A0ABT0PAU6_9GAMM|nr:VCBS domain-containing protein [Sansalvadorimonas sp. 2012CJ34-2]MCL6268388.1 VCBS domain-containing protein [Sansalvadorimonas sp. 2012CJ34-2]
MNPQSTGPAIVTEITGEVIAVAPDGSTRPLEEGGQLLPGETIQGVDGGQAVIRTASGEIVLVSNNYLYQPVQAVLQPEIQQASQETVEEVTTESQEVIESPPATEPVPDTSSPSSESSDGGGNSELSRAGSTPILSPAVNFLTPAGDTLSDADSTPQSRPLSFNAYGGHNSDISISSGVSESDLSQPRSLTSTSGSSAPVTAPEPEPVMTLRNDSGDVRIGAQLLNQTGLLGNDSLPEGARITAVNGVTIPKNGEVLIQTTLGGLTVSSSGSYSYNSNSFDPATVDSLEDNFTYTVTASDGTQESASLTLSLHETYNHLPELENHELNVAFSQSSSTVSAQPAGLLGMVVDQDGDTTSITIVNGAVAASGTTSISGQYGTLIIAADGTYSYVPLNSATQGGTDTFTYTVSDGHGTVTANLAVNVLANDFATHDTATIYESEANGSTILVYDNEGNRLLAFDTATGGSRVLFSGTPNFQDVTVGTNNVVYGATNDAIYTINIANGTATSLVNHTVAGTVEGITMSSTGVLYAVNSNGVLSSIDVSSGLTTAVGNVSGTPVGGITWHNGEIYMVLNNSVSGENWLTRVDVSSSLVTPIAQVDDPYTAFASINGQLSAVDADGQTFQINPQTGAATELSSTVGEDVTGASQLAFGQVTGNVITNDTGAVRVTAVSGADGLSSSTNISGETIVRGQFGELKINADGSYTYHLDNNSPALAEVDLNETVNDRFVYMAVNNHGGTAQSVLSVNINGATDVSAAHVPTFSDTQHAYVFHGGSESQPLGFTVDSGANNQRITGITITGHGDASITSPTTLTDAGSVTTSNNSWSWSASSGNNAGLESLNARNAGLTLSNVTSNSSNDLHIEVTVTEYDANGVATSSWTSTVPYDAKLVHIDQTVIGDSANNTLTGNTTDDEIIGGGGNDILTGGGGIDVFTLNASDVGTTTAPAVDRVMDFALGMQGDVLNIADLIPNTVSADNLDQYLSFNFENGSTTIGISSSANGEAVQQIVLQNVDLSAALGTADTSVLINNLTDNGNLMT